MSHDTPTPYYGYPPPPPVPGAFAYIPPPVIMYPPVYQEYPSPTTTPPPEPVEVVDNDIEELIDWIPSTGDTASTLTHRAFVAGKEGWDGSPLWVIRSYHNGELVPGKLAVKHRSAYISHAGKEVPVHNFEVLCARPHALSWVTASKGEVPVGAITAGNTHTGEPLYIGRVKHQRSITPGKVHPTQGCCYISFSGHEVKYRNYEVLCMNFE